MEHASRSDRTRSVLADTSGLYSLFVTRDNDHQTAHSIYTQMQNSRHSLFTTNYLLAELHALILTRENRHHALRVIRDLISGQINILRVGDDEELRAVEILSTFTDKDFSFVDATSFAVMERLNVTMAFTFDRHFAQFGFRALCLEP